MFVFPSLKPPKRLKEKEKKKDFETKEINQFKIVITSNMILISASFNRELYNMCHEFKRD